MIDSTNQYALSIIIRGKTPATEYFHTDGNTYIEGRKGSPFAVELENKGEDTLSVVFAVDGTSVRDNSLAGPESKGFIIPPYSVLRLSKWIYGDDFTFKDVAGSIGVMVFRQQRQFENVWSSNIPAVDVGHGIDSMQYSEYQDLASALISTVTETGDNVASCDANIASPVPTTTWSPDIYNTRRDPKHPDATLVIYYDSVRGLEKRGIDVLKKRSKMNPDPFPNYKR